MSARALKARLNAAPANNARRHSGLNRAFSAAFLGRTIFLARCPRLVMNAAPLALDGRMLFGYKRTCGAFLAGIQPRKLFGNAA
jgi:hypothetical protein